MFKVCEAAGMHVKETGGLSHPVARSQGFWYPRSPAKWRNLVTTLKNLAKWVTFAPDSSAGMAGEQYWKRPVRTISLCFM